MSEQLSVQRDSLFRNKRYLFLISAQAVSNLGDWLYILALFIEVGIRWHSSPTIVSIMMLSLSGPIILFGPLAGVLADRFNRTLLMIISNLVMALLIAMIPLLPARWEVFVILIGVGTFQALFGPAEQGKLKEIVSNELMHRAVSTNTSITQLTKIVGPGLSGLLVGSLGTMSAYYMDSASFILSTLLLLFTGFRRKLSETDESNVPIANESFLQRVRVGWAHIVKSHILWFGTLLITVIMLLVQLTDSQFVTLFRLLPSMSPNLFGYVMAASGMGALLVALVTAKFEWTSAMLAMAIGALALGIGFGGEALMVHYRANQWLLQLGALIVGAGASFVFIPFQTLAQRNTPAELSGRVFGVIGSLTTGSALLGPVAGALVITAFGPILGFLVTGLGLIAIGMTTIFLKNWIEPRRGHVSESNRGI